jgi:hypothetical protein
VGRALSSSAHHHHARARHAVPCAERRASSPRSHRAPASQQLRPFRRLLARRRPEGRRVAVRFLPWDRVERRAQRFDRRSFRRFRRRLARCGRVPRRGSPDRRYLRRRVARCGGVPIGRCAHARVGPHGSGRAAGTVVEHLEPQRCTASGRGSGSDREAGLEGRARRGAAPQRRSPVQQLAQLHGNAERIDGSVDLRRGPFGCPRAQWSSGDGSQHGWHRSGRTRPRCPARRRAGRRTRAPQEDGWGHEPHDRTTGGCDRPWRTSGRLVPAGDATAPAAQEAQAGRCGRTRRGARAARIPAPGAGRGQGPPRSRWTSTGRGAAAAHALASSTPRPPGRARRDPAARRSPGCASLRRTHARCRRVRGGP